MSPDDDASDVETTEAESTGTPSPVTTTEAASTATPSPVTTTDAESGATPSPVTTTEATPQPEPENTGDSAALDGRESPEPARAKARGKPKRLPEDLIALPNSTRDTIPGGLPLPRPIRKRVQRIVSRAERRAEEKNKRRDRTLAFAMRISMQVLRQWARDRCPQQAASLAFQTVLSIVPLVAVTLAVLRATNSMGAESSFVNFLATQLIPVSPDEISKYLLTWSSNVTFKSLGMVGLISTVLLAFVIINSTEKVINFIWRAERKRSIPQKFVVFYATATIAPFLLGTWLYQGASVGWTEGFSGFMLSSGTSYMALFLANFFLPACPVKFRSAAIGALVSTVLFELAKFIFNTFVYEFAFERYTGIYGAVAIAPLWLLWIYYSWLTFLLGVEVAHAAENLHLLQRVDRRHTLSLENELLNRVNGMTAARVMVEICRAYSSGEKAVPRSRLEFLFDMSSDGLGRLVRRLKEEDLVIEVHGDVSGYMPARPPSEITLATVLAVFRGDDVRPDGQGGVSKTRLDDVIGQIDADTRQRTARLTLDQLI